MPDTISSSRHRLSFHEFSALAGELQKATEAIMALCRSVSNVNQQSDPSDPEPSKETPLGEYRQYRLSAHTLREEQKLLERCEATSFTHALSHIHAELYTTAFLLKGYNEMEDLDNFPIHLIKEHLQRSLDMLSKACSVMADYHLVHVIYAPDP